MSNDLGRLADDDSDADAELDALVAQMLNRPPAPVDWRQLPADRAAAEWAALDDWVRWLTHRYALDHRELPPCWSLHGAMVEELSALHTAHTVVMHPGQPATGPADWHQNFGYTRVRLREWAARTGCKPGGHRPDSLAAWAIASDGPDHEAYEGALWPRGGQHDDGFHDGRTAGGIGLPPATGDG